MLDLLLIVAAAVFLGWRLVKYRPAQVGGDTTPKEQKQLSRLIDYANRLYSERKWLAAEKAYLEVLKHDHKNLVAYGHLGIMYSLQKNFEDSIECFKIAGNLNPSASNWQNLGLAYYENKEYDNAVAALEKSIIVEPSTNRYMALGRVYKHLNDVSHMLTAFENAVSMEASRKSLLLLQDAYIIAGDAERVKEIRQRLKLMPAAPKPKKMVT